MAGTPPQPRGRRRTSAVVAVALVVVVGFGVGVAVGWALGVDDDHDRRATPGGSSAPGSTTALPATTASTAATAATSPPVPTTSVTALVPPTGVGVEARCDAGAPAGVLCDIVVSWTDTNAGETGYRISVRSDRRGVFAIDLAPNSSTFTLARWDTGDGLHIVVVAVRGEQTASGSEVEVSTGVG